MKHRLLISALLLQLLLWLPQSLADCNKLTVLHLDCFNQSLGTRVAVTSFIDCAVWRQFHNSAGLTVAQWSDRDGTCRLFKYQRVCQQLRSVGRFDVPSPTSCRTVIGTKYDAIAASKLFLYFWVGDTGTGRMESLACTISGVESTMMSTGVSWTSEGPRLDGANSSRLWSSELFGLRGIQNAMTTVLRLKRRPAKNILLEMNDCDTFKTMGMQILEQNYLDPTSMPNGALYADLGPLARSYTIEPALPSDEQQFFTLALAVNRTDMRADPLTYDTKYFVNNSVVPHRMLPYTHILNPNISYCLSIGRSNSLADSLNGVVAAVGIAFNKLDEADLRRVFRFTG